MTFKDVTWLATKKQIFGESVAESFIDWSTNNVKGLKASTTVHIVLSIDPNYLGSSANTWQHTRLKKHNEFIFWATRQHIKGHSVPCKGLLRTPREESITKDKKYILSNSESLQCNFFMFDYVMFIQFKICCCVQNFMKIWWLFTEIWRYIDFQNGGCPPSWNCFTTIRDHPQRGLRLGG